MSKDKVTSLEVVQVNEQASALLHRARNLLTGTEDASLRELADDLPVSCIDHDDDRPQVVFAGAYSAGKSTLLRAITGRDDIAVGRAITTDTAAAYEHQGVVFWDTPGIHTELRPDHDEISYQAIDKADFVIFVITSQLMDAEMAEHFRALAIERDKGHEMLLVVNHMSAHRDGNSAESQAVIRDDLRRVLHPFSPEDLRICFTDAQLALDARDETDPEVAAEDLEDSGLATLVAAIDELVRERGLLGRSTTALYQLQTVLERALSQVVTDDPRAQGLREMLLQKRTAILEAQSRIERRSRHTAQGGAASIRQRGREVVHVICEDMDPEEVNRSLAGAQSWVDDLARETANSLRGQVEQELDGLVDKLEQLAQSPFAQQLGEMLEDELDAVSAGLSEKALGRGKVAGELGSQLGRFLVNNSFSPTKSTFGGLMKLRQYSGTNAHTTVKQIGRIFGKSFKPWEAVKWGRFLANIGRVLTVVGTVLNVVVQVIEDKRAKRMEHELRDARASVRACFSEAAGQLELQCRTANDSVLSTVVQPEVLFLDQQLRELEDAAVDASELRDALAALRDDTAALIQQVHRTPC